MDPENVDLLSSCLSLNKILWFAGYANVSKCMRLNKTIHAYMMTNAMPKKTVNLNIDVFCRCRICTLAIPFPLSIQFYEKTRLKTICEAAYRISRSGEITLPNSAPLFLRYYVKGKGTIKHGPLSNPLKTLSNLCQTSFTLSGIDNQHSALKFLLDTFLPRLNVRCLNLRPVKCYHNGDWKSWRHQELEITRDCLLESGISPSKAQHKTTFLHYSFKDDLQAIHMEIASAMKASLCVINGHKDVVPIHQLDTLNFKHIINDGKWDAEDLEIVLKEWISGQRQIQNIELNGDMNEPESHEIFLDLCDRLGRTSLRGPCQTKNCDLHLKLDRSCQIYNSLGVFYYESLNKLEIELIHDW